MRATKEYPLRIGDTVIVNGREACLASMVGKVDSDGQMYQEFEYVYLSAEIGQATHGKSVAEPLRGPHRFVTQVTSDSCGECGASFGNEIHRQPSKHTSSAEETAAKRKALIDDLIQRNLWPSPEVRNEMASWTPLKGADDVLARTLFDVILNMNRERAWDQDKIERLAQQMRDAESRDVQARAALRWLLDIEGIESHIGQQMVAWVLDGEAPE